MRPRVDFARFPRKRHALQRADGAEGFGDVRELEERGHRESRGGFSAGARRMGSADLGEDR